jgi:hypothetical protein
MFSRHPALRPALALAAALATALAGCDQPDEAAIAPSDFVRAAPNPTLLPDAEFTAALATAAPAVARIEAGATLLAARAEALQARAEGLGAPVIDPADRDRLEAVQELSGD